MWSAVTVSSQHPCQTTWVGVNQFHLIWRCIDLLPNYLKYRFWVSIGSIVLEKFSTPTPEHIEYIPCARLWSVNLIHHYCNRWYLNLSNQSNRGSYPYYKKILVREHYTCSASSLATLGCLTETSTVLPFLDSLNVSFNRASYNLHLPHITRSYSRLLIRVTMFGHGGSLPFWLRNFLDLQVFSLCRASVSCFYLYTCFFLFWLGIVFDLNFVYTNCLIYT